MKIFKTTPQWDIMGKKKIAFVISSMLLLASLVGLGVKGLTYGIDFKGGTLIQIKFQEEPPLARIRELFQRKLTTTVNITTFGEKEDNEVIVTLAQESIKGGTEELTHLVDDTLRGEFPGIDIRRVETVGRKVGGEFRTKAVQAAFFVLIGILIYIGIRFKVRYGIAAVVALFHDVLITVGVFVYLEKEFTLTILAALLTIIGYSLNDTIVVFDRIRENVARFPKRPLVEVINLSVNESLSRTILTSVTTFLVVFTLFMLGGDIIKDFSFAMLIGLVIGTYSSVFVASPVVLYFDPANFKNTRVNKYLEHYLPKLKAPFSKRTGKKAR
ncbi:MAG: protein translocase subunit SecF [Proteobacteria bacterium]|nr:protein translocase subunit SecF [Pseudomonadota bacterium]